MFLFTLDRDMILKFSEVEFELQMTVTFQTVFSGIKVTLILKFDLDAVKILFLSPNKIPGFSSAKLIAPVPQRDRQTEAHTVRQI